MAVEQWFGSERRARSLATLTLIGGLAGPIFIPLTSSLVEGLGWRPAARLLAGILVVVGGTAAVLMARTSSRHVDVVEPEQSGMTLCLLL